MAFAPNETYFDMKATIRGGFHLVENNNFFEYSINDDDSPWAPVEDWPFKVWVTTPKDRIDSGYRYAKVLKTRIYIAVDEDDYGRPVVEKWLIKQHRTYEERV